MSSIASEKPTTDALIKSLTVDSAVQRQLLANQIRVVIDSTPRNLWCGIVGAVMIAAAASWDGGDGLRRVWPWLWCGLLTLGLANGIRISRRFLVSDRSDDSALHEGRMVRWNAAYCAVMWGSSAWLLLPANHEGIKIFVVSGMGMMLMGGAASQAIYRTMLLQFLWLTTGVFSIGLLRLGGPFDIPLAFAFPLLSFVIMSAARTQEEAVNTAFLLRLAAEEAASQLTAAQADVASKTSALIELTEERKNAAERANKEKSLFLAQAIHDVKQPASAMVLLVPALLHALKENNGPYAEFLLSQLQSAGNQMSESFNAVLDLSRIEAGSTEPRYSNIELNELVRQVVLPLRVIAGECGVDFSIKSTVKSLAVVTDPTYLWRILTNLISNAIKYRDPTRVNADGSPDSRVVVGIVALGIRARIDVVDNGIGIPSALWERIYDPFFQRINPLVVQDHGLGLGLSIVKAMVGQLVEHKIEIESIEGKGTRFSVEFPRSSDSQIAPSPVEQSEEHLPGSLKGCYAVVLDDEPLVLASMTAFLRSQGMVVEAARTVDEWRLLVSSLEMTPDVLISDYDLRNETTAVDALRLLHGTLAEGVPVLLVTGEAMDFSQVLRDTSVLADIIMLPKPVTPNKLLQALADLGVSSR